jgi:hypothetical protein
VSVLLGNGDGSFQDVVRYGVGAASFFVAVGDVNGAFVQFIRQRDWPPPCANTAGPISPADTTAPGMTPTIAT